MSRPDDIKTFYRLMDRLAERVGGPRRLADCSGRDGWPERGVYFFFEHGELRKEPVDGLRVVRVGTHGLTERSHTTLWRRLRQHRGSGLGGGNHRGSVFRWWVGDALARRDPRLYVETWLDREAPAHEVSAAEHPLECLVSECIGQMPFLWVAINDPAGRDSRRAYIERNSIALLSGCGRADGRDAPSLDWLGSYSSSENIRESGLWNSNHVHEDYDRAFLADLQQQIMASATSDE